MIESFGSGCSVKVIVTCCGARWRTAPAPGSELRRRAWAPAGKAKAITPRAASAEAGVQRTLSVDPPPAREAQQEPGRSQDDAGEGQGPELGCSGLRGVDPGTESLDPHRQFPHTGILGGELDRRWVGRGVEGLLRGRERLVDGLVPDLSREVERVVARAGGNDRGEILARNAQVRVGVIAGVERQRAHGLAAEAHLDLERIAEVVDGLAGRVIAEQLDGVLIADVGGLI